MVIGIGLNVNETNNDFPDTLSKSATSLAIETNQSNQRELLCAIITTYFERLLNDLPSSYQFGKITVTISMNLFLLTKVALIKMEYSRD